MFLPTMGTFWYLQSFQYVTVMFAPISCLNSSSPITIFLPNNTIPVNQSGLLCHFAFAFDDTIQNIPSTVMLLDDNCILLWGRHITADPDHKKWFAATLALAPQLRADYNSCLDACSSFTFSQAICISFCHTQGQCINMGNCLCLWCCQEHHLPLSMPVDEFLCSFQSVICALYILPGLYLSNLTTLDLKTIFLLAFPYHIHCQYTCNTSSNLIQDSIKFIA